MRTDANGVMLRPDRTDDFVRQRAAEMALPEVKAWGGRAHETDEEILSDLVRSLPRAHGYEIAKSLEELGWRPDADLVQILDGNFIDDALSELVAEWVAAIGVKLTIPVGEEVLYRSAVHTVARHIPDQAQYGLRTPDMKQNSWIIVPCESVAPVPPREQAA